MVVVRRSKQCSLGQAGCKVPPPPRSGRPRGRKRSAKAATIRQLLEPIRRQASQDGGNDSLPDG